jgi:16S rRNA (guanine(966)-N(2))-methyltransferase RsmD
MSDLRIIGGKARGRRIRSVPGDTTRPITDKVRQALFNIIGPDIQGASFLDLFSGTGSVGIEALSRGAAYVQLNELSWQPVSIIRDNLKSTGLEAGNLVTQGDAFTLLDRPASQPFDYIYIAPPQYKEMWSKALLLVDRQPAWLSEDGWTIVQIHPIEYQPVGEKLPLQHLVEFDQRHYGSTILVFYRMLEVDDMESENQGEIS